MTMRLTRANKGQKEDRKGRTGQEADLLLDERLNLLPHFGHAPLGLAVSAVLGPAGTAQSGRLELVVNFHLGHAHIFLVPVLIDRGVRIVDEVEAVHA